MYPSDYGYAVLAEDCARTETMYSGTAGSGYNRSNCVYENWIWPTDYTTVSNPLQWTISPYSANAIHAFFVNGNYGYLLGYNVYHFLGAVRPVWYLTSNAKVISGDGSVSNPYVIQ